MQCQAMRNGQGKNYTVSKIFIDTNILVYTLDSKDLYKQTKARKIIEKVVNLHQPVISTQVLKLKADGIIVKNIIHNFCNMEIVQNDLELIEQAIDISIILQLSFWDSLIVAAAEKAKCECIISEDLNPGQTYRGVMVINPFKEEPF